MVGTSANGVAGGVLAGVVRDLRALGFQKIGVDDLQSVLGTDGWMDVCFFPFFSLLYLAELWKVSAWQLSQPLFGEREGGCVRHCGARVAESGKIFFFLSACESVLKTMCPPPSTFVRTSIEPMRRAR